MQVFDSNEADQTDNPIGNPFSLSDTTAYKVWRERKLAAYPTAKNDLLVPIQDAKRLDAREKQALLARLRTTNFVVYQFLNSAQSSKEVLHAFGQQLGLHHLDSNLCADDDAISSLQVIPGGRKQGYIPYSNLRISWHTDGYYNDLDKQIRAMLLHCVQDAARGGENLLLDHEICYIHLRDTNPDYIQALMQRDAMTIPPNVENGEQIRAALTGPVFSVEPKTQRLHMRYTARTRSIEWKNDALTREASECMRDFLHSDSPYVLQHRLQPGQGVLCNNILHARNAFDDEAEKGKSRLLFRARYFDRVGNT